MTAYIPKRDPPNGNNGDTVQVQLQVPTAPSFVTADGVKLVPANTDANGNPIAVNVVTVQALTRSSDGQSAEATVSVTPLTLSH
jgi:hypothetical protein